MVLIHLKSQFVSLIVTVLSGAAELCLFGAALGLNRYAECNALKRGRPVSVRFHRMRTKFLAVFAMVVFIILEVVVSFFSDPALAREPERRPCIAVDRYDFRTDNPIFSIETDSVLINCIRVDGNTTFQRLGNRSTVDGDVRCAKSASYKWEGEAVTERPLTRDLTVSCIGVCVFTELRGREFYFSALINPRELDRLVEEGRLIPFLVTTLFFDIDKDQEEILASRAIQAYNGDVTDPLELRRRILTGSERTNCTFFNSEEATEVPGFLIALAVPIWSLSLLLFILTHFLKGQIFYDMGDPLHWAQRTHRNIDEPISGNPVVTSVYEHGERLMYVSSSSSDEYDFLKRLRTNLRDRIRGTRLARSGESVEEQQV